MAFSSSFQAQSEISTDPMAVYIPREVWEPYDPMLIADGLFAAGNIFAYVIHRVFIHFCSDFGKRNMVTKIRIFFLMCSIR